jgi:acetyl-CoA carboxylase carboxyltransferase component
MRPPASALPLRARVKGSASSASTTIDGRPVVLVRIDPAVHRGALTEADGTTIASAAALALQARVPFVAVISSSGADVYEGLPALHGWGLAARAIAECSGIVPTFAVVTGPALSGPALLLGLCDIVVMTVDAYAWVSGPNMVRMFTGVDIAPMTLGGAHVHATESGVAAMVVADEEQAMVAVAEVIRFLPDNTDTEPDDVPSADPPVRPTPEAGELIPAGATGSYDVRKVIAAVVDEGHAVELRARYAPNLVTSLAAIGGRPVGIVANQPQSLAGTLDIGAAQKGARFVAMCDAFNLPIVTFVDTPGFFPGKTLEWRGMIRHGAQLVFAYAEATVPRICVVLRKAYGGAYIVMDCKTMGNDLCLAWPTAEIAVMGAKGAVAILHRRADAAEQAEHEREYEATFLTPWIAAERGLVDAVIDPADTRRRLASALTMLRTKRERVVPRAHSNSPL